MAVSRIKARDGTQLAYDVRGREKELQKLLEMAPAQ